MKTYSRRKQWIEDFLNGLIDREQADQALKSDPSLRKELEFELRLREAVEDEELISFEEILEKLRSTKRAGNDQSTNEPKILYRVLLAVASVILVVAAYLALQSVINNKASLPSDFLIAKAEFPHEIYRGDPNLLDSVALLSAQGNYDEANRIMESITDISEIDFIYARGISRYNAGKYEYAIGDLSNVVIDNDNLFVVDARWYRALCYLHLKQSHEALKDLKSLSGFDGPYKLKATRLLRNIEMEMAFEK